MKGWTFLSAIVLHAVLVAAVPLPVVPLDGAADLVDRAFGFGGNGAGQGQTANGAAAGGSQSTAKAAKGAATGAGQQSAAKAAGNGGGQTAATAAKGAGGQQSAAGTTKGAAASGSKKQATAVQNAADSFAGDVATVSASINGIGMTTDKTQIKQLASQGFAAEQDEDQHRAVLNQAGGSDAASANQKIVANTPIVLDGLESIMKNPSAANTAKQRNIESARNANILPSITQLSNSAFDNVGINTQAKTFQKTTGVKNLKSTVAAGN